MEVEPSEEEKKENSCLFFTYYMQNTFNISSKKKKKKPKTVCVIIPVLQMSRQRLSKVKYFAQGHWGKFPDVSISLPVFSC